MTNRVASIVQNNMLPKEVVDWLTPRIFNREDIKLCMFLDGEYGSAFYFLTNSKIIILHTGHRKQTNIHWYYSSETFYLEDISKIRIFAKGAEFNRVAEDHEIELRFVDNESFQFYLNPEQSNVFETTLLSLMNSIKPRG